jgi:dihydroorotate dehydrogenase electron transfer subunit
MVIGARDEEHLLNALEARRTAGSVTVVTDDGSVGERGRVVDVAADAVAEADVVYASGPVPLLGHVAQVAEQHGAWSQLALERALTCATGLCHGCPVPVTGEDRAHHVVRACLDGPVFRGDRVRWGELRSTPLEGSRSASSGVPGQA